jgi:hypothetical protein
MENARYQVAKCPSYIPALMLPCTASAHTGLLAGGIDLEAFCSGRRKRHRYWPPYTYWRVVILVRMN